jgi:hypothetical protein
MKETTPLLGSHLEINNVNTLKHNKSKICVNILLLILSISIYIVCTFMLEKIDTKKTVLGDNNIYYYHQEPNILAEYYENNNITGWAILKIKTNSEFVFSDDSPYYAGYLEGYLSAKIININWLNIGNTILFPEASNYIENNLKYMQLMIKTNTNDEYWININYYLTYIEGLHHGYSDKYPKHLTFNDILSLQYLNLADDMGSTSCTALIRLVEDNILYGHATWYNYNTMIRMYKDLRLPFLNITYSGYPGIFNSEDDFYINSKGLVVMETSLNLYKQNYTTENVPVAFRTVYATHKSSTSHEWCENFSKYNDDLYNNQWLIMDSNKQFFVLEQGLNLIIYKNLTSLLLKQKFFLGYNVLYFTEIYDQLSDDDRLDAKNDNRYNLTLTLIDKVKNIDDMKWFMRYNNYTEDINTEYNPMQTIASRYDLCENEQCDMIAYGAIDAKITSETLIGDRKAHIISKLADIEYYPFDWTDLKWENISHVGLVDTRNFDWLFV